MTQPKYAVRSTRKAVTGIVLGVSLLALIAAAGGVVWFFWSRIPATTVAQRCVAETSQYTATLTPDQAHYASIIVGVSVERGLPERAATVAIATAYQESKIDNIDYGDRDSVGLFQQRPSQGWGTVEEIMDPVYSTNAFYDGLVKVEGWQNMEITEAAQAVQRSAFPTAYAQHEDNARAVAAALTGQATRSLTCYAESSTTGDATALRTFLASVYGDTVKLTVNDNTMTITPQSTQVGWSVAQAVVANYSRYNVSDVTVDGSRWTPQDSALGEWSTVDHSASTVVVTIAS